MPTITTLLVANRGEIARRVFRTARAMGIRTVAVYSEPDADSPHVYEADLAVALSGSKGVDTYLSVDRILDAARRSRADAIHPGYGFLSENAEFAEACVAEGLLFVGPRPENIREMGLKDRAKAIARAAGVPVLPDAAVEGDDPEIWCRAARAVGYPLLVKATAGGGGKGMRMVATEDELAAAVRTARRESSAAFGDATVFLERYLSAPRHIEIQVFGDEEGGAVHLIERECSIQRRHQKVLEECPSPVVTPRLRARMGATAVDLVRSLSYVGAGTVEFLLDDDEEPKFYFLEMNTRLQVEHPTTEAVTGLDLVRMQLEVAMGRPLALTQDDVVARGHAIEARLYAEDPARDFMPTPGRLHLLDFPHQEGVRLEVGVPAAADVSPFYDPMLAKVIAHAAHREETAARLAKQLAGARIHGVTTNRDFLVSVLEDNDFLAGATRTDFIERHPNLLQATRDDATDIVHLAAAVSVLAARRRSTPSLSWAPPGWRILPGQQTRAVWESLAAPGEAVDVSYRLSGRSGHATLTLEVRGRRHEIAVRDLDAEGVRVTYDRCERDCRVSVYDDGTVWVSDPTRQTGWRALSRLPERERAGSGHGGVAAIPGTVVAVQVRAGDRIEPGQVLVVLEAMKMEHQLRAERSGTVKAVLVTEGQYIEANAALVDIASEDV